MEVIIYPDAREASVAACDRIQALVAAKPDAVLALPTGNTPRAMYAELAKRVAQGELDLGRVQIFMLDEFVGLPHDHEQSYHTFAQREIVGPLNLRPEQVRVLDGTASDLPRMCAAYEEAIAAAGGIDLCVLGIGQDGHIAFNEPSSSLASRTRVKALTPATIKEQARAFGEAQAVPRHVVTMGVATILEAKRIILLAFGRSKALVVAKAVEGPITAFVPASALQMHPAVTAMLDPEASEDLRLQEYYQLIAALTPNET